MGLTGQAATVDELLTGRENLRLIGAALRPSSSYIKRASDDLLERFSLTDAGGRIVKTYSGGMRRRLDLAVSLIATPPVLFLDEPTTGLDPRSRVELWEVLRELVRDGTTLLLTTQYLEEADQLADRIVVIDKGRVIAEGTPLELKDSSGRAALVVTVSHADDLATAEGMLRDLVSEVHVDTGARQLTAPANGLKRHDPDRRGVRRQHHRAGRPGPQAAEPGRRVPAPHRSPGRGRLRRDRHRHHRSRGAGLVTTQQSPTRTTGGGVERPEIQPTGLLRQSLTIVRRNLIHIKRMPEMLMDVTIQPVMFVLLFAFVFGGSIDVPGTPNGYDEWLLGGIMGQTIAFASFIVAVGLTADIDKGIVDRMRSLPINPASVLVGRSLSSLLHSSIGIVVMSLTGLLIGWRIRNGIVDAALAYLLLLMWGFAMIWVGILVGSAMRSVEAVNGLMFTTMFPITFLANTFAPTEGMTTGAAHDRRVEPDLQPGASGPRALGQHRPGAGLGRAPAPISRGEHHHLDDRDHRDRGSAGAAVVPAPHRRLTGPASRWVQVR